ncbi:selenocysteine lyase-like isoform X1 [Dinothrombium tinctorium]|uniref:Selenocysteine lyase n=1 Tax=Dinothrombium tinctorium TaxID=1965070 RepID=A0A3S3SBZ4_9ACAR|nr:selenocysteine lyase-like isoform X1 [Dinothrombium tinctorium]
MSETCEMSGDRMAKNDSNFVYLDFNATTPLELSVIDAMTDAMSQYWFNPSSGYDCGQRTKAVLDSCRYTVGEMINCRSPREEIIFTSGGTEANNWLIHSFIREFESIQSLNDCGKIPHVITSNVEHDSIATPLKCLSSQQKLEVTFVPVSHETGSVDPYSVIKALKANTVLITIMLANNETGFIQNVSLISRLLQEINEERMHLNQPPVYLHTDAAQAIGKIAVDVQHLNVDYLTIVGHKFYAPRVGALYHRKGSPLHPLFYGGGQEYGLRPGTENILCIVGLAEAAKLVIKNLNLYNAHFKKIRKYLEKQLKTEFNDEVTINGESVEERLPNTVSVAFNDTRLKGPLVLKYARRVRASVGAACHSNGDEVSSVLLASGVSKKLALCTLRLSVGRETSESDIDTVILDLRNAVNMITQNPKN